MKKPLAAALCIFAMGTIAETKADEASLKSLIARHAAENNIPEALVHRIVRRESNYNPRAVGRGGAIGLMQIKYATAKAMGYSGSAPGLLDADTNLTYAVRYLAGAYKVADGNHDRAVSYYASGFYYAAKRKGLAHLTTAKAPLGRQQFAEVATTGTVEAAAPPNAPAGDTFSLSDFR
jgi:soluble lytic murein transglycosylase-like protein